MSSPIAGYVALGAVTFAASVVACAFALHGLKRWAVIDAPNERSSHARPTPRGGGLGFIAVVLIGWMALSLTGSLGATPAVMAGAAVIAAISFVDDLRGTPLAARLAVQALAVFLALATFPPDRSILADFLPLAVDRVVVGLAWLWFINLFNFMDGIDGIAGSEALIVALGLVVQAAFDPDFGSAGHEAVVIGAAVAGFLLFNWPPARMFMGDIGSASLGYLLGWLMIVAASRGALVPTLVLPLYFIVDASTTLAARAWRRKPLGTAHRDHAYQHAVDAGVSHAVVSGAVLGLGVVLIALSLLALSAPLPALGLALALTAAFVGWLRLR